MGFKHRTELEEPCGSLYDHRRAWGNDKATYKTHTRARKCSELGKLFGALLRRGDAQRLLLVVVEVAGVSGSLAPGYERSFDLPLEYGDPVCRGEPFVTFEVREKQNLLAIGLRTRFVIYLCYDKNTSFVTHNNYLLPLTTCHIIWSFFSVPLKAGESTQQWQYYVTSNNGYFTKFLLNRVNCRLF